MDEAKGGCLRWLIGIVPPLFLLYLGITGIIHRRFTLDIYVTRFQFTELTYIFNGSSAIAVSIASIAFAVCCHAFIFWSDNDRLDRIRTRVVVTSIIVAAISLCVGIGTEFLSHR